MSMCRTCEYALYDGMCMAHGKFTLLDAPACDDYKMHLDVEVSKLKAENAKLHKLVGDMWTYIAEPVGKRNNLKERLARIDDIADRMRDIGIEVDNGTE